MARKQQIKEIVIKTSTVGSEASRKEIDALKDSMRTINEQIGKFVQNGTALTGSIASLSKMSGPVGELSKNLTLTATALKSINRSSAGSSEQTMKLSGYISNLEILGLTLREIGEDATFAERGLNSINGTSGMKSLINLLAQIQVNTGKTAGRIKDTREAITDLDVTTNRASESFEEYSLEALDAARATSRFTESTGRAATSAATLTNNQRRLSEGGRSTARSFSQLAFGANPLVSAYASIAVNVFALTAAFRLLSEASSFERLKTQTAGFSAAVSGINVVGLAQDMQEASAGALSLKDSLSFATRGVSYNFGAEAMRELTVGARKASIALGTEFSDALDRVLRGISKKEIEVLDEVGVITTLTTAYGKYAAQIGKTIETLTEYDKQTALTLEVTTQLDAKFKGIQLETTGWEKLGVAVSDLATNSLGSLSLALDSTADGLAFFLDMINTAPTTAEKAAESLKIFNDALAAGDVIQAGVALQEYQSIFEKAAKSQEVDSTKVIDASYKIREAREDEISVYYALAAAMTAAGVAGAVIYGTKAVALVVKGLGFIATAYNVVTKAIKLQALATLALSAINPAALAVSLAKLAIGTTAAIIGMDLAFSKFAENMAVGIEDGPAGFEKAKTTVEELTLTLEKAGFSLKELNEKGIDPAAVLSWSNSLKTAKNEIEGIMVGVKETATPLDKLITQFNGLALEGIGLTSNTSAVRKQQQLFKDFQAKGIIPKTTKDFQSFVDALILSRENGKKFITTMNEDLKIKGIMTAGKDLANVSLLLDEVNALREEYNRINDKEGSIAEGDKAREELATRIAIVNAQLQKAKLTIKEDKIIDGLANKQSLQLLTLAEANAFESEILDTKFDQLEASIKQDKLLNLNTDAKELELKLLEKQVGMQFRLEAVTKSAEEIARENSLTLNLLKARGLSEKELIAVRLKQLQVVAKNVTLEGTLLKAQNEKIQGLKDELQIQKAIDKKKLSNEAIEYTNTLELEALRRRLHIESDITEQRIKQLKALSLAAGEEGRNDDADALDLEIKKLEAKNVIIKTGEQLKREGYEREDRAAAAALLLSNAGSSVDRVAQEQVLLNIQKEKTALILNQIDREAQERIDKADQNQLNNAKDAAPLRDGASTLGSMQDLDGLDGATKSALGVGELFSSTFADAAEAGKKGFSGFSEYLQGNMEAFNDFSIGLANAAGSIYSAISDAKIAGIDREINAEKKRDGKSVESLAKIKKLEAKKIKEKAKADKASIAISTATGVMQTFAQYGFPTGVPMAAGLAAMGLYQISQVDKAANGSIGNLSGGGGSNLKIESGSRDNKVDVSRAASAGEYAFVKGQAGQGNAGSFSTPGRVGGGSVATGASIILGERGPEEVTPTMPVNVTPSGGSGKSGSSLTFSPTFNIEAMDSSSFEAVTQRYSKELFDSLEGELRARNLTLENLA